MTQGKFIRCSEPNYRSPYNCYKKAKYYVWNEGEWWPICEEHIGQYRDEGFLIKRIRKGVLSEAK